MRANNLEIVHGLETPYPLQPSQNYVRLEGWAFILGQSTLCRVRLRVGSELFEPAESTDRSDVGSRFPEESHAAASGFVFICYLPFGNHTGVLEVSGDQSEQWLPFKSMVIPVSSHPLMGQFEPAGVDGIISEPVRLAGWCWHPEFSISEVIVLMGNVAVPVGFGLERPDVADRFPDQPTAKFAGFMTRENLPRGSGKIRLRVTTQCGRIYFLDPGLRAKLKSGAFLPPLPPPEMWQLPPAEPIQSTHSSSGQIFPGPSNILFVLFGDFTSNSAYHVTALANALIGMGYDCIVAVPDHAETIEAQPTARFLGIEFSQLQNLGELYSDGKGPAVTHLWTPRESVRLCWRELESRFTSDLVIHLEDNEQELLRGHLGLIQSEIDKLSPTELDAKVPLSLSHPTRSQQLLSEAKGITTIIESLSQDVPKSLPSRTFWPAATDDFTPLDRNVTLRRKLGIADEETVIFYHGNVHSANMAEVNELYQAVAQLNDSGNSTWLIRTGRDCEEFKELTQGLLTGRLINGGFVKRAKDLPILMSMADIFVQPGSPGAFNDYRFPSKLPEFFAIGRPVILPAANLGQQVEHGQDAYVLANANAVSIADAIAEICNDPALIERLSSGSTRFAQKHFSWQKSAESLAKFYLENTRLKPPESRRLDAMEIVNKMYHSQPKLTCTDSMRLASETEPSL